MTWNFQRVAGPFQGATGGLAWDGSTMLVAAVKEERIYRYDPANGKVSDFRRYTGRTNGIAIGPDGAAWFTEFTGGRIGRASSSLRPAARLVPARP